MVTPLAPPHWLLEMTEPLLEHLLRCLQVLPSGMS